VQALAPWGLLAACVAWAEQGAALHVDMTRGHGMTPVATPCATCCAGMLWMWDLSATLGWAKGGPPGSWLTRRTPGPWEVR